jgi:hypothetical protein
VRLAAEEPQTALLVEPAEVAHAMPEAAAPSSILASAVAGSSSA